MLSQDIVSAAMSVVIPLPLIRMGPDATGHPYPIQIGLQTEELLQATVFYMMLSDLAAGQRVRQSGAIEEIENELIANGLDLKSMNNGWELLNKYKALFSEFVIQSAPVAIRNHWDWYIRKLGRFVEFARSTCASPSLSREAAKQLASVGKREMPLLTQLEAIRVATGLPLVINAGAMETLQEMSLVRNLVLHNRGEVDHVYIKNTATPRNWVVGEVRLVQASELLPWRSALSQLLIGTWSPIAKLYAKAPSYSG